MMSHWPCRKSVKNTKSHAKLSDRWKRGSWKKLKTHSQKTLPARKINSNKFEFVLTLMADKIWPINWSSTSLAKEERKLSKLYFSRKDRSWFHKNLAWESVPDHNFLQNDEMINCLFDNACSYQNTSTFYIYSSESAPYAKGRLSRQHIVNGRHRKTRGIQK